MSKKRVFLLYSGYKNKDNSPIYKRQVPKLCKAGEFALKARWIISIEVKGYAFGFSFLGFSPLITLNWRIYLLRLVNLFVATLEPTKHGETM